MCKGGRSGGVTWITSSAKGIKCQQAGYKKVRSQEEAEDGGNSREHGEALPRLSQCGSN